MKRLQLLFHNLGLGDVISFSPLILLALDHGFSVDVGYETMPVPGAAGLFFGQREMAQRVRFLKREELEGERCDAAVLFDRRLLPEFLQRRPCRDVLCMPVPERRRAQLRLYNHVLAPAMRVAGLRPRPLRGSSGASIGRMAFEDVADYLDVNARHSDFVTRVRALLPSLDGVTGGSAVMHLFRDQSFKRLGAHALQLLARTLVQALGSSAEEITCLFDAQSIFEREVAEYFAGECQALQAHAVLLPSPTLEKVAQRLAAAPLYVGVDHGISHLAALLCPRSLILYGGSRHHNDIHLLWRPLIAGELVSRTPQVSSLESHGRRVALIHPRREEYLTRPVPDSYLINSVATEANATSALSWLGFPGRS